MKILFLCVANSARSQMAEGLARQILPPKIKVESAGSLPGRLVHPLAIQVMSEIKIDISNHAPKAIDSLAQEFTDDLDLIITLCREEQCPILPGSVRVEGWALPDPADADGDLRQQTEKFRNIRDQIQDRIEDLKRRLSGSEPSSAARG